MGPEHGRLAAIGPLSRGDWEGAVKAAAALDLPAAGIYADDGTPNQRGLGIGNALAVSRILPASMVSSALAQGHCYAFLDAQEENGHQAVGPESSAAPQGGKSVNEQMACTPHDWLWLGLATMMLAEADHQKLAALLARMIDWWAVHMRVVSEFWTPAGLRVPCARALSLPPQWVADSRAYALICLSQDGVAADARYGKVLPEAKDAFNLLRSCAALFPQIRARMATVPVKLQVPIRRWRTPSGLVAAFDHDSRAIDKPCAYISVSLPGIVTDSGAIVGKTLDVGGATDVIGGPGGTVVAGTPAPAPPATVPPISPGAVAAMNAPSSPRPAAPAKPPPSLWRRFLAWLRGL